MRTCLTQLEDKHLQINLNKCRVAKSEMHWREGEFTQTRIMPLSNKTDSIESLKAPKSLKNIKINKRIGSSSKQIIPLQPCVLLRTLLRTNTKLLRIEGHENQFNAIKQKFQKFRRKAKLKTSILISKQE